MSALYDVIHVCPERPLHAATTKDLRSSQGCGTQCWRKNGTSSPAELSGALQLVLRITHAAAASERVYNGIQRGKVHRNTRIRLHRSERQHLPHRLLSVLALTF